MSLGIGTPGRLTPYVLPGACALPIDDFNGDGVDEVFAFAFGGNGKFIVITGYETTTDNMQNYCYIPFDIIDSENGPGSAGVPVTGVAPVWRPRQNLVKMYKKIIRKGYLNPKFPPKILTYNGWREAKSRE
jgi:hypothetical protein